LAAQWFDSTLRTLISEKKVDDRRERLQWYVSLFGVDVQVRTTSNSMLVVLLFAAVHALSEQSRHEDCYPYSDRKIVLPFAIKMFFPPAFTVK
jgi:hypothetical protein